MDLLTYTLFLLRNPNRQISNSHYFEHDIIKTPGCFYELIVVFSK